MSAGQDALQLIRRIPLFGDLEESEVMDILRMARPKEFKAGDVICAQGDPGDCMYAIQDGEVSVTVRGMDGSSIPVANLGAGDLLGEMNLVDDSPRSANAIAATAVRAFRIDREQFEILRAELHPAVFKVMRRIALTVCGRLRRINGEVSRVVGVDDPVPQQRAAGNVQTRKAGEGSEENLGQALRTFWSGLLERVKKGD